MIETYLKSIKVMKDEFLNDIKNFGSRRPLFKGS